MEGSDWALEAGTTFSVEPGVYLEGAFGVRIEDIVAVTADGVERLNRSTRDAPGRRSDGTGRRTSVSGGGPSCPRRCP